MITIDGISGAWNYTIGPAFIWEGPGSLDELNFVELPVVVVAKYIALEHLGRIDMNRVLGFVVEEGGPGDPTLIVYSNQHRATVLQAAGALEAAEKGRQVVVDGVDAKVFFDPDDETLDKYRELRRRGPPPEPPGMVQKLVRVATDFSKLDPAALKGNILDFPQLGRVLDGVLSMMRAEKLDGKKLNDLKQFAKGTPVEQKILKNLERYQEVQPTSPLHAIRAAEEAAKEGAAAPAEAEAAARVPARSGEAATSGSAGSAAERRRAREGSAAAARAARGGQPVPAPEPEPAPVGAVAAAAPVAVGAGSAVTASAASPSGSEAKDVAGARRAAREAEMAAAQAARSGKHGDSGGGDGKK